MANHLRVFTKPARDGLELAAMAAVTIAIAGILHLVIAFLVASQSLFATSIFVLFALPQLFWAIPMLQQWGKKWYLAGAIWNMSLVGFFFLTLVPNPVTGNPIPPVSIDMAIQALQWIFIGASIALLIRERRRKKLHPEEAQDLR
jgi:hypothetical protein